MKTVACVYWKGEFRNRENVYDSKWVYRLKNMVIPHLPQDEVCRFVCLTNVPEEFDETMEVMPLINDWHGWWSKLELFKPNLFDGTVLYLDLDLFVVGGLQPFFDMETEFAIIPSFPSRNNRSPREMQGEIVKFNSSVMVWNGKNSSISAALYTVFNYHLHTAQLRGDQDWIGLQIPQADTFVKRWVIKYRDLPNGELTGQNRIVLGMAGGGMPKKNESIANKHKWAKKIWKI